MWVRQQKHLRTSQKDLNWEYYDIYQEETETEAVWVFEQTLSVS